MSTKSERKRASNQAFSISISNRRSEEQSILCLHNLTSWCWPPRNKCLVLTFKHVLNTFPCSIQFSVCIDDSHLSLIYAHYKPSHFCCKISQNTFYLYKIHQNRKKKNNIIYKILVSDHLYRFCKFLIIFTLFGIRHKMKTTQDFILEDRAHKGHSCLYFTFWFKNTMLSNQSRIIICRIKTYLQSVKSPKICIVIIIRNSI